MSKLSRKIRWISKSGLVNRTPTSFQFLSDTLYLGVGSRLEGYDRFTGNRMLTEPLTSPTTIDPTYITPFRGTMVIADDSDDTQLSIYKPKKNAVVPFHGLRGHLRWLMAGGQGAPEGPNPGGDPALYGVTDQTTFIILKKQRSWRVVDLHGPGTPTSPLYVNGKLFLANRRGALAYDIEANKTLWVEGGATDLVSPALEEDRIFFANADQHGVTAFSRNNGRRQWSSSSIRPKVEYLGAGGGTVYAACDNGEIFLLDSARGTLITKLELGHSVTNPMLVNQVDGIFYAPASPKIYAYDPNTTNLVDRQMGAWPYVLKTSGTDVYAGGGNQVGLINFSEALKQFTAESHLLQDFEEDGKSNSCPNDA